MKIWYFIRCKEFFWTIKYKRYMDIDAFKNVPEEFLNLLEETTLVDKASYEKRIPIYKDALQRYENELKLLEEQKSKATDSKIIELCDKYLKITTESKELQTKTLELAEESLKLIIESLEKITNIKKQLGL